MQFISPLQPDAATSLALALISASHAPLLLLDDRFTVISASASFCSVFALDPRTIEGTALARIGEGEWNEPQLHSLLGATLSSNLAVDAYEMNLVRAGLDPACVSITARRLDLEGSQKPMLAVTITDITSARLAAKLKDELVQEKQMLLQELQHRVANSLQIIASVLMQSARRVHSEETRTHLHNAHNRILSIATLQRQLAVTANDDVGLLSYFKDLCASIGASMIEDDGRISLTSSADESRATANISVSLGLIVTELVINALKHAFPHPDQTGSVTVDYAASAGAWTLKVEDDGVGMIAGEGSGTPGLGTGIVAALARQLGATVTTSNRNPGTTVSIVHEK